MTKKLTLFVTAICFCFILSAQVEKEISSEIKKVTVFTKGAQVEREAAIPLQEGKMIIRLTGLSPYIKKESIRIDGESTYTIQTVQHLNDYLNELDKTKTVESLKNELEEIQFKIEEEEVRVRIIKDKLDFLYTNKDISGKQQSPEPEAFKSLNTIYGSNIETLNLDLLARQRKIKEYNKELSKLNNQYSSLNSKTDLPSGTILVTLESKQTKSVKMNFNYIVDNAAWYPSYDFRFLGVDKPLNVTYKANIRQNTGIDWNNVKLVLSTAKTDISAKIPLLTPFYVQFYYPDVATALEGRVAGVNISGDMESDITIRGIASINSNTEPLYIVDGVPQKDISLLSPEEIENIEVLKDASASAIYGSRGANGVVIVTTKSDLTGASVPLTIISKRETSDVFIVEASQTILSDNKTNTVNFRESGLEADFEYQAVPKLSENVYLIGKINNWYRAGLLDGEVNLYFENSFVGKSNIDTEQFKDTLEVSFGIDNNISIKREKLSEYSGDQLVGANRKETIAYKLIIRNNKSYPVTTKISDQIPVSATKEIQVEPQEISQGILNKDTGLIEWKISLNPKENKELLIKYSVKYPKDRIIITD